MRYYIFLSLAFLVLVGAGCAKSGQSVDNFPPARPAATQPPAPTPQKTPPSSVTPPSSQTFYAVIGGFTFGPASIKIKAGDTVAWTNQDAPPHSVTADDISQIDLSSPLLSTGQKYSFTFKKPGVFKYHCSLHPSMKGVVVVE